MAPGAWHLGFFIPYAVTSRYYRRDSTPTRGECGDCGVEQELTYALWDGTRECRECIKFLVSSNWIGAVTPQEHPPQYPVEGITFPPFPIPDLFEKAFE